MTDARFPERWLNDRRVLRLPPVDFRSFVVALSWSVSNRTDGRIEADDLALIPNFEEQSVAVLTNAGLWTGEAGCWQVADFDATQSSKAQLEGLDHKRHQDRERQARKRAKDNGQEEPPPSRDSPRDVTRDDRRDTKDRTGQDRQGAVREEQVDLETGEVLDPWDQPAAPSSAASSPVDSRPVCPEPGCTTHLVGIELQWGKCRDHREGEHDADQAFLSAVG